jgi:hypothetical protein
MLSTGLRTPVGLKISGGDLDEGGVRIECQASAPKPGGAAPE